MTAIGKLSYGKWVRSKASRWLQWEARVNKCQANTSQLWWIWAGNLLCFSSSTSGWRSEHLKWSGSNCIRCLKILGLFSCWVCLPGLWVLWIELSAQCLNVKLSMFWGEHYKLCHSNLFALWESKLALPLKLLVDQLYSPLYYCIYIETWGMFSFLWSYVLTTSCHNWTRCSLEKLPDYLNHLSKRKSWTLL